MYIVTAQHEYTNKNNMAYMYIVTAQHEYKNKKQNWTMRQYSLKEGK